MNARNVLLIESVEAAGAAARDVEARARTLMHAGCGVRSAVVEPLHADRLHGAPFAPADPLLVHADVHGRRLLREWIGGSDPDLVLVASAVEGGGEVGRWVSRFPGLKAWWWPSGISGRRAEPMLDAGLAPAATMGSMLRSGPLSSLPFDPCSGGASGEPWPGACTGLGASVLADARLRRSQLPLWDGDYVLAPLPLSGAAGRAVIDAFASICEVHDAIDLVVLSDPQPSFERYARECGIGFRVHFAGEARRDAELAWLGAAAVAVVAGDGPLSGGLVLRALERGCPLLAASEAATAAPLEAWLAAHGLAIGAARDSLQRRLEGALERDAARRAAGRVVASLHGLDAAADRLSAAIAATEARPRAA